MGNLALVYTFVRPERERGVSMEYLIVDAHLVVLHDDVLSEFKQTLVLQPSLYLSKQGHDLHQLLYSY